MTIDSNLNENTIVHHNEGKAMTHDQIQTVCDQVKDVCYKNGKFISIIDFLNRVSNDVSIKIIILARETGLNLEYEDVKKNHFLPDESINTTSNDEFILSLKKNKAHFNKILNEAKEKNCRLKFVAKLDDGNASVGLEAVSTDHPFYNLVGSDNITVFHTERYKDSPLVVKGAGAGGEFTASGVFADIIKASQENG